MTKGMSMTEMQAKLAEITRRNETLEAQASKKMTLGAIRATPSKKVRDGEATSSIICIKNVNANPQFPITCHASQFVRLFEPETVQVLIQDVLQGRDSWLYRSPDEKAKVVVDLGNMGAFYTRALSL